MDARPTPAQWYRGFAPHLALSIFIACGMLVAGWVQFALHRGQAANAILLDRDCGFEYSTVYRTL